MVVGDIKSVAFEIVFGEPGEGRFFIYIHGHKLGNDKFDYNLAELCL